MKKKTEPYNTQAPVLTHPRMLQAWKEAANLAGVSYNAWARRVMCDAAKFPLSETKK